MEFINTVDSLLFKILGNKICISDERQLWITDWIRKEPPQEVCDHVRCFQSPIPQITSSTPNSMSDTHSRQLITPYLGPLGQLDAAVSLNKPG